MYKPAFYWISIRSWRSWNAHTRNALTHGVHSTAGSFRVFAIAHPQGVLPLEVQSFVPFSVMKHVPKVKMFSLKALISLCHCIVLYCILTHGNHVPPPFPCQRIIITSFQCEGDGPEFALSEQGNSRIIECRLRNRRSLINLISNVLKQSVLFVNGWIGKVEILMFLSICELRLYDKIPKYFKFLNLKGFFTRPTAVDCIEIYW